MVESRSALRQLLAQPNVRNLWLGQLVSQVGNGVTMLAVLIVVNQITGSTLAVATMAICMALPQLLFGLVAGVFVDRWDRRRVMILSDVARGLLILSFALVRRPEDVWIFYVAGFLQASIGTLFNPAISALIPEIIPKEQLTTANSLSQSTQALTMMVGPALAGVLVGTLGSWSAFCFDALTFFASAAFIARIAAPARAPRHSDAKVGTVLHELREGVVYLFGNPGLTGIMALSFTLMLGFGAVNVLFVPFLTKELHVRTELFGSIAVAQTAGLVIGSVLVAALAARIPGRVMATASVALAGLLTLGLSGATAFWHLLLVMFGVSCCMAPVQVVVATTFQKDVPAEFLGRTGSVIATATTVASLISMAAAGVLGDAFGLRHAFIVSGAIIVIGGCLSALLARKAEQTVATT